MFYPGKRSLTDGSQADTRENVGPPVNLLPVENLDLGSGGYELLPYAITDGYDQIEVDLNDTSMTEQPPPQLPPSRHDSVPTTGYSALASTEQTAPTVYCRMDPYEKPNDENHYEETKECVQDNPLQYEESILGLSKHDCSDVSQPAVNYYLTLSANAEENDSDEEIPSSYLKI